MDEALLQTNINNAKIVESIKLQRDFHLKHIELVRLKKSTYERYKLAVEQQRMKNADFLEHRMAQDRIESVCDIQMAIFKTLEESDLLLDQWNNAKRSPARVSLDSDNGTSAFEASKTSNDSTNENSKLKKTKSDGTIVDDMHTLNHQLHILVHNLVTRIDESSHELDVLRERVKSLEKDRNNHRKVSLPISNKSSSDSSGKADESPTQSAREIRLNSVSGEERKIVLPDSSELPPLELPEFDYNF